MRRIIYYGSIPKYEPEVIRFLNAISVPNDSTIYFSGLAQEITGIEVWEAIHTFVVTLKNAHSLPLGVNNLKNKIPALYLLWGGFASSTKYNLSDARDLDAAFRIIWGGGVTHSATGVAFNGTNGYGDTKLMPDSVFSSNYYGYVYSINSYTTGVLTGARDSTKADFDYTETNGVSLNDSFKTITGSASNNITSLYRLNSTQIKYRRNGSSQTLSSNYNGGLTTSIYIGAYNSYGTSTILFSNANLNTYAIISQPSDGDIATLENAIAQLNIDLHR